MILVNYSTGCQGTLEGAIGVCKEIYGTAC